MSSSKGRIMFEYELCRGAIEKQTTGRINDMDAADTTNELLTMLLIFRFAWLRYGKQT